MEVTRSVEEVTVPWWVVLLQGFASLIVGVMLLASPGVTTATIVLFIGWYWLIGGVFEFVGMLFDHTQWGWKLFSGLLGIAAGWVIVREPLMGTVVLLATAVIVLGIQGLILGGVNIARAFQGAGWGVGVLGALSVLIGIFLLSNTLIAAAALPFVYGVMAVVGGVTAVFAAFRIRSTHMPIRPAVA